MLRLRSYGLILVRQTEIPRCHAQIEVIPKTSLQQAVTVSIVPACHYEDPTPNRHFHECSSGKSPSHPTSSSPFHTWPPPLKVIAFGEGGRKLASSFSHTGRKKSRALDSPALSLRRREKTGRSPLILKFSIRSARKETGSHALAPLRCAKREK